MENTSMPSISVRDWPWMDKSLSPDERANLLLAQMTQDEKVNMLCEQSDAGLSPSRLGIPLLTFADGPAGVRIDRSRRDVNEGKATSPPAPIALAATWDLETAEQYGDLVGLEAWATGHNVLFGPGLDIARIPVFGRLFEALGEDPVLTGQMAARYIQGVQGHPVEVAVVVVRDYNNEHADRPSLTLPHEQDLLVEAVAAANPRTIVVVASGGPVLMPWLEQVPAVLEGWYGGQEVGNALADIMFGGVSPSGKLPVTFPRTEHETPVSLPEQYSRTALVSHFSEGLAVGYRGYDQFEIDPLFSFGYGLSYTSFAYVQLRVEPETTDGSGVIRVSFTIKNTGEWAGAEVAQVYLGLPAGTGEPPKRLVGWVRVELEPGETREVSVILDPTASSRPLSYWNVSNNKWEIASGDYEVYVGASSRDMRLHGSLRVHYTQKLEQLA
jgi:hypothetical protein